MPAGQRDIVHLSFYIIIRLSSKNLEIPTPIPVKAW